jgi:hypothetical protein
MRFKVKAFCHRLSLGGHHPTSPMKMMFKVIPSATEVTDTVIWNAKGVVLVDILPCGQTINSDLYIQTVKTL